MVDFSKYLDWIKLSPRYLLPLAIFTGFVVLAPLAWLDVFALTDFVERYRPYFGFVCHPNELFIVGSHHLPRGHDNGGDVHLSSGVLM